MNKVVSISLITLSIILFFSCKKTNIVSLLLQFRLGFVQIYFINDSIIFTEEYDSVCGCDGITYSNLCKADRFGVTSYKKGNVVLYFLITIIILECYN